ncbi:hypothetical protein BgAZ_102210 [Babesia gibsoni]|uniref:Uncharacterized protein n=1 Tax=Babesia gibsoni TaxID=33632 RepID=A0AAD8PF78_BABGI|nr:hypothetical protein BgAZ_102210 [Babesia gibsoni]
MKSVSSSSRSMSVSRSFSNYVKRSASPYGKRNQDERHVYSRSSSRSSSSPRPHRRRSDSRGSSSRSYSPPRRRHARDSSISMSSSRSASRSRRKANAGNRGYSSMSSDSSMSYPRNRRSRSSSRQHKSRRGRGSRRSVDDSRSSEHRGRSYSSRSYTPPRRRDRTRGSHDRYDKKRVVKNIDKSNKWRKDGVPSQNGRKRDDRRAVNRLPNRGRMLERFGATDQRKGQIKNKAFDRTVHTPFLLRIYAFVDDSFDVTQSTDEDHAAFQRKIDASDSVRKLELYIWADSTLRDLVGLVKDLCESARSKDGIWRFHLNNKTRDVLGEIHSYKWHRSSDSVTLKNTPFLVGDSLLLLFHAATPVAGEDRQMPM